MALPFSDLCNLERKFPVPSRIPGFQNEATLEERVHKQCVKSNLQLAIKYNFFVHPLQLKGRWSDVQNSRMSMLPDKHVMHGQWESRSTYLVAWNVVQAERSLVLCPVCDLACLLCSACRPSACRTTPACVPRSLAAGWRGLRALAATSGISPPAAIVAPRRAAA